MTDDGMRALAAAVLRQAVLHRFGGGTVIAASAKARARARRAYRDEAAEFLRPENPMLQFWCACVDLDPEEFCTAALRNGRTVVEEERRWRKRADTLAD